MSTHIVDALDEPRVSGRQEASTFPVDGIRSHPDNPRRIAEADTELVDSVRAVGVAQAITLAPDPDAPDDESRAVALAGHRRLDAARKAGLTVIPAHWRLDLVTRPSQIEFMLVENLQRLDLTPIEEGDAYEQLELFGVDAETIAKATGRRVTTVRQRLQLGRLPQQARDQVHAGHATLGDAEAMLEFADDPDASAKLVAQLGKPMFRHEVEYLRRTRADRQRIQERRRAGR